MGGPGFLQAISDRQRLEVAGVLACACLLADLGLELQALRYVALGLLLAGVFSRFLSGLLAWLWLGFGRAVAGVMSPVVLGVVYVVVLLPISVFVRATGRAPASLRRRPADSSSNFRVRNHRFGPEDLRDPW